MGDALIFGDRVERIDAGQIDERELPAVVETDAAYMAFDGNARVVSDLLAKPGEGVEKGGFAGIWGAD